MKEISKENEKIIKNFKIYENIRSSGLYNMMTKEAMDASGLSNEEYLYCMNNYDTLYGEVFGNKK